MQRQDKKFILFGILSLLALSLIIFCFTHTLVIFQNNSDDLSVYMTKDENDQKTLTLRKGTSRWMVLPKGHYTFFATDISKGRESLYAHNLGGFSKKTIRLSTDPQKQSEFLGENDFDCSVNSPGQTVFFPCDSYEGFVKIGNGLSAKTLSVEGAQAESSEEVTSYAVKPYKDMLLAAHLRGKALSIYTINPTSSNISEKKLDDNFEGFLKNNYVATAPNGSFAIFDSSTKTVLVYKSMDDRNPQKISLDKQLSDLGQGKDILVELSDKDLSVVLTDDITESSDSIVDNPADKVARREASEFHSTLFSASLASGEIKDFALPNNAVIDSLSVDSSGNLVLFSQYPDRANVYEFTNNKFITLSVPEDINYACASSRFIYFNTDESKIYRYSTDDHGARLVYKGDIGEITRLNCTPSSVSFGVNTEGKSEESTLRYMLTDKDQDGSRIDGWLPLYYTFKGDSYVISQTKNGVLVSLEYDSNGDGPSSDEEVRAKVLEELKSKTRFTKNLEVQLAF